MGLIGEYERKQALRKEQKPRDLYGTKVTKCNECRNQWQNYKGRDYGFCQAMGFHITKPEEMCRMCPLPLWEDR